MSFRARLTSFFLLIVVVPMIAFAFLVFRLIGDSEQGKADARANGLATAAASLYASDMAAARLDARAVAREAALASGKALRTRLATVMSRTGLVRVAVSSPSKALADVGDRTAIAPGIARITSSRQRRAPILVRVSELTATQFARELTAPGVAVVVRQGGRTLGSTLPGVQPRGLPQQGNVTIRGTAYRAVTMIVPSFAGPVLAVSLLSNLSATNAAVGSSRLVAAAFIVGFLLLAFGFSLLASRALQGQLGRFLQAARRLGRGDFSSQIDTRGNDEFAALGAEFNNMSRQLEHRLEELSQERARLRESISRIGQALASNLDLSALLEVSLRTATDAVQASCGRMRLRNSPDEPLSDRAREGALRAPGDAIAEAERTALDGMTSGEAHAEGFSAASLPLVPLESGGEPYGLLTVAREGDPFSKEDLELLRSLAAQTSLALENVQLHFQVRRQAVTDELTSLANHGRFQELLGAEMEQVRRYEYPVGLIMLDIDDFKAINDTYGHQQGDVVLKQVARVLRDNSRDADTPARYGGEEMALILPHTELEGSYAIAERIRAAVETLRIPAVAHGGTLRITASVGVAASTDGSKDALIGDADGALYQAKRQGKNRTITAPARATDFSRAE